MTMSKSSLRNETSAASMRPPPLGIFVYLTISLVGIVDAGYLTVSHYQESDVSCSILDGCSQVLNSSYATILGAPTALYGLLFYMLIFFGTLWYLYAGNLKMLYKISIIAIIAFFVSLGFVFIQAFVLEAWCFYCVISASLSTLLGINAAYILYILNPVIEGRHKL